MDILLEKLEKRMGRQYVKELHVARMQIHKAWTSNSSM